MVILKRLTQIVADFFAERDAGRLAGEVTEIRESPGAMEARAARETATNVWPVGDDPEVRLARQVQQEILQELARAGAHLAILAPLPLAVDPSPKLAEARKLVAEIEAARMLAHAWLNDAATAAQRWIWTRRRLGLVDLEKKLLKAVEQAHRLVLERQQYVEATGRLAKGRDPADAGTPFASLIGWGDVIERARRALAGPRSAPPPPPPAGSIRLKVLDRFRDSERMVHLPGDVVDLPEDDAAQAKEKGWAVAV